MPRVSVSGRIISLKFYLKQTLGLFVYSWFWCIYTIYSASYLICTLKVYLYFLNHLYNYNIWNLTPWKQWLSHCGRCHHFSLLPDGDDNDKVAGGDADGRDHKQGEGHQRHVELPVPLLRELNPALRPILLNLLQVVEEDDGDRESNTQDPGSCNKKLCTLPCKSWSKKALLTLIVDAYNCH